MTNDVNVTGGDVDTSKAEAPGANKCSDCGSTLVNGECTNKDCERNRDKL